MDAPTPDSIRWASDSPSKPPAHHAREFRNMPDKICGGTDLLTCACPYCDLCLPERSSDDLCSILFNYRAPGKRQLRMQHMFAGVESLWAESADNTVFCSFFLGAWFSFVPLLTVCVGLAVLLTGDPPSLLNPQSFASVSAWPFHGNLGFLCLLVG